jgi:hypothetical protein
VIRTIRRAAVLAAIPAALAIGVTATPASAATIGTAYSQTNFGGTAVDLESGKTSCTDIPNIDVAFSAKNNATSGNVIILYSDSACSNVLRVLAPTQQDADLGVGAVAYRSVGAP